MITTCTRRFQFCAGHRVFEHGSKCRHLHGHNYVAFVTCQAEQLDRLGMVVDFSVIKDKVGKWIDENWDHGFIFYHKDTAVREALGEFERQENTDHPPEVTYTDHFHPKLFGLNRNPTAENMAAYLFFIAETLLGENGVKVVEVELYETENCSAKVREAASIEEMFSSLPSQPLPSA